MKLSQSTIIAVLSACAGAGDLATGLLLIFAPRTALALMRVPEVDQLVFLQFVGCFVGAVGLTYFIGLITWAGAGITRLRVVWELTLVFRFAAATFVAVEVAIQNLPWQWLSVTLVDLLWCAIQATFLWRGFLRETDE